jgi:hypothetical protein
MLSTECGEVGFIPKSRRQIGQHHARVSPDGKFPIPEMQGYHSGALEHFRIKHHRCRAHALPRPEEV